MFRLSYTIKQVTRQRRWHSDIHESHKCMVRKKSSRLIKVNHEDTISYCDIISPLRFIHLKLMNYAYFHALSTERRLFINFIVTLFWNKCGSCCIILINFRHQQLVKQKKRRSSPSSFQAWVHSHDNKEAAAGHGGGPPTTSPNIIFH